MQTMTVRELCAAIDRLLEGRDIKVDTPVAVYSERQDSDFGVTEVKTHYDLHEGRVLVLYTED